MNRLAFLILLICSLFSCKKEYPYDPETGMEVGETILLTEIQAIDTFPDSLVALAQFVNFDTTLSSFVDPVNHVANNHEENGTIISIQDDYVSNPNELNGYKHIILLNTDRVEWLEKVYAGYYLERYFQQVDANVNCKAEIISFDQNFDWEGLTFWSDNANDFGDSTAQNMEAFYLATNVSHGGSVTTETLANALRTVLDFIQDMNQPNENYIISLFMDAEGINAFGDFPLVDTLISDLQKANVRLNLFTTFNETMFQELAFFTGGFYQNCDENDAYGRKASTPVINKRISETAVVLQNLHNILLKKYTNHTIEFSLKTYNPDTFKAFNALHGAILYRDLLFPIAVQKKP